MTHKRIAERLHESMESSAVCKRASFDALLRQSDGSAPAFTLADLLYEINLFAGEMKEMNERVSELEENS